MIYIYIIFAVFVLCYIYDYRGYDKGRLTCYILVMLYLICLSGFRYKMGTDALNYELHYKEDHSLGELTLNDFANTRYAPFYVLLTAICKSITSEFVLVQFVITTIVNVTVFRFVWKNTRHVFTALMLYIFFLYIMLNMEVYREAMAVCVFLWSWPLFRDGKWVKYYMCAFLAFMFHISSIVLFLLPICCVPGIRRLFRFGPWLIITMPLLLAISFSINYYLFDFIELVALTDTMYDRAEAYSDHTLGGTIVNVSGALVQLIKYVAYPLVALCFIKKNKTQYLNIDAGDDKNFEKIEMMSIVSMYFSLLTVGVAIFHRYQHYFLIFPIIVMSIWAYSWIKVNGKRLRLNFIYWSLIFLPLIGLQYYSIYLARYNKSGSIKVYEMYYPYSSQFDKDLQGNRAKAVRYSKKKF